MYTTRGIITIAFGKKYASQAKYLAYSCMLHSANTLRAVITDCQDILRPYYDFVIPYPAGINPFSLKTMLYLYTPFEKTAFIDADSLFIHPMDPFWDSLDGSCHFVYTGNCRTEGVWYFDIARKKEKLNVNWIPEFNSGMFLFDKSASAKSVFDDAHTMMQNYTEREIKFFRGAMFPDEPFFAMALAKNGVEPFSDHQRFSRTLIDATNIRVDVIRGISHYYKDGRPVFPGIVHFCGQFGNCIYFFQRIKLFFYFNCSVKYFFFNLLVFLRTRLKKST